MKDVFVIDYGVATRYIFHGEDPIDKEQLAQTLFHIDNKVVETVVYIPESISLDDTVRTLKYKLFKYCNIQDVGIDELYVTSHEMKHIVSEDILRLIDDMGDMGMEGLKLMLRNFRDKDISQYEVTDVKVETIRTILKRQEHFLVERSVTCNYSKMLESFVTTDPYQVTKTNSDMVVDNETTNRNIDLKTLLDLNVHNHNQGGLHGLYICKLFTA